MRQAREKDGVRVMDFFVPELVDVVQTQRLQDARSIRVSREARGRTGRERVRSSLAGILGLLAASIHAEAARAAVGLRRVPHAGLCDRSAKCGWALCLCEE